MTKNAITGLIAAMLAPAVYALDPVVIKDIRVEGIQRTEAGTVFNYLPVKVGDTMTDEQAAEAVKKLFATGFFKDVRLEMDSGVLVVVLEEQPAIAAVDFVGIKEFDKEQLRKGLRDVGLAESRIFDRALVERAEQELKRQYLSRGHYAVPTHDDRHAPGAQPRRYQLQRKRGRDRQDQADQRHRRHCVQGKGTTRPVRAAHAELAELVHQE